MESEVQSEELSGDQSLEFRVEGSEGRNGYSWLIMFILWRIRGRCFIILMSGQRICICADGERWWFLIPGMFRRIR